MNKSTIADPFKKLSDTALRRTLAVFLIVYALFISIGCVFIGRSFAPKYRWWTDWGFRLGWSQFLAALLDAVENFALLRLILGAEREAWPALARWCAIVKFSIVAAGLAYILVGLTIIAVRWITGRKR